MIFTDDQFEYLSQFEQNFNEVPESSTKHRRPSNRTSGGDMALGYRNTETQILMCAMSLYFATQSRYSVSPRQGRTSKGAKR